MPSAALTIHSSFRLRRTSYPISGFHTFSFLIHSFSIVSQLFHCFLHQSNQLLRVDWVLGIDILVWSHDPRRMTIVRPSWFLRKSNLSSITCQFSLIDMPFIIFLQFWAFLFQPVWTHMTLPTTVLSVNLALYHLLIAHAFYVGHGYKYPSNQLLMIAITTVKSGLELTNISVILFGSKPPCLVLLPCSIRIASSPCIRK